jgi:hypothetical protein
MNDGSSGAGRAAREVEQRYGRDDLALRGFAPLLGAFRGEHDRGDVRGLAIPDP